MEENDDQEKPTKKKKNLFPQAIRGIDKVFQKKCLQQWENLKDRKGRIAGLDWMLDVRREITDVVVERR